MRVSPVNVYSYKSQQANPAFDGYWKETSEGIGYPFDESSRSVYTYYPDESETLTEMESAFQSRVGRAYWSYITGGQDTWTRYDIDPKNKEIKKAKVTKWSEESEKKHEFDEAVRHRIEVARILKDQKKEHDKFITERKIESLYQKADEDQKRKIRLMVMGYNYEMATSLDSPRINWEE